MRPTTPPTCDALLLSDRFLFFEMGATLQQQQRKAAIHYSHQKLCPPVANLLPRTHTLLPVNRTTVLTEQCSKLAGCDTSNAGDSC